MLKANLKRLLNPRHIAFVGGHDAAFSASQCAEQFTGPVWGVNPGRKTLGGVPCYPTVRDLPEAPDAVFIATPRSATTDVMRELNAIGAGGAVCFTAGYGELGQEGQRAERELIEAAGNMALVGPNCYGLVNYTNGAILWPFGAGKSGCQRGIALIMQSGMLPANMTMNDRSVPITFVISAGNQSVLAIEDYMEELVDDSRVTAIGIYAEGIKDIEKFSQAAVKALEAEKPVAIIKAGQSEIAASLSMTHTGSLSGSDDAFQALFDQLGVIRVDAPAEMLETLKFLSVSGAPKGNRIAGFTCSGGDAAMLADRCDRACLELPRPVEQTKATLTQLLPDIATVTNPLDYTTPLWGNREVMPKVFSAMVAEGYDAAVVIQDFPPHHIHSDLTLYHNDTHSFITACSERGIPAAVCSDLPENIDRPTRELMIAEGVTPLQGIDTGINALANACRYGIRRHKLMAEKSGIRFTPLTVPSKNQSCMILDEWESKKQLSTAGVSVPKGLLCALEEVSSTAIEVDYPVAVKAASKSLPHKSEAGAVKIGLQNYQEVTAAIAQIQRAVQRFNPDLSVTHILIESMVEDVVAELLVGIDTDPQFGQIMVIAGGGVWVELIKDKSTLLLPTSAPRVLEALQRLKIFSLLQGFRGRPGCNLNQVVEAIMRIAGFAADNKDQIVEMDINPLIVTKNTAVAADVMIRKVRD
ncbi:MAG: acetate--CoA ligase family protein [Arenicellales bacterium]